MTKYNNIIEDADASNVNSKILKIQILGWIEIPNF